MNQPTDHGKRRWPDSAGYLPVVARHPGDPEQLPCTCQASCIEPDCKGSCGCEACCLAWLVFNDDHAVWDESGNLILPDDQRMESPWQRISNAELLRARCQGGSLPPKDS